ncbi:MAG TPA: D-alanyl-D-alanine carboxypeptidase/D-alanyl-D-alanine-endopeptidase, partial [Miltoncostaeaceae bacterium]|nr:D-alanyl-D-alanine carboxypeptidase/D-alanyl-D-alanine-endopeptidase [Miltoncostaeaceae bacterium]
FLPTGAATPFADLARPLRRAGIRTVSGPIVADDSLFDDHTMVPSWPAYYADYTQPLSALAVNQDYAGDDRSRDADRPWLAAAQRLRNTLTGLGIRHRGALRHGRTPPGVRSLGVARSAPLARAVREMNLHSDNFIAEMLVKNVGVHALGAGSTAAGTERIRQVLIQRRILTPADRLADGSGLSRDNRLSAASLARVIAAADGDRSWGRALLASLPHGGEGTLIRRLTEADVAPRVQAKTGFINGAASLSGRVISRNGQRYAFAFLMNTDRIGEAQQLQDRVVALLARGAEDTGRTR